GGFGCGADFGLRNAALVKPEWPGFRRPFEAEYSGLNLNQDKATKPQTVQIVRQGEATPYWFKVNPLYLKTVGLTP
ncbi:hypothetical protein NL483_28660, partial [Klebsiella pneumoniae]|nr:hypothetical protein [Klebsiella pneumoniae]